MNKAIFRFYVLLLVWQVLTAAPVEVTLRSRVEAFKGSGQWQEVSIRQPVDTSKTAVVICDMWDNHWCSAAARRVGLMVPKMVRTLDVLRNRGILIIHAPSETMEFYKDSPQRAAILKLDPIAPPEPLNLADPPLPVDASAGGCDTPDKFYKAWTRQHPGIPIGPNDLVSDKGQEVYTALRNRGVTHILVMGVHTNMCILNRSFAVKQMTKWGLRCILVRDLTDAMYDPKAKPFVTHEQGTELVIQHIEKYWCPTVESTELLRAFGKK